MDATQLQHLTDKQREDYKVLESFFGHPGWPTFMKWAEKNADEARDRAATATTWDANRMAYGARVAFVMMQQLREQMEMEYAQIAADAAAGATFEDEGEHE